HRDDPGRAVRSASGGGTGRAARGGAGPWPVPVAARGGPPRDRCHHARTGTRLARDRHRARAPAGRVRRRRAPGRRAVPGRAGRQHALARTAARQALDLLGVALPADAPRWGPAGRAAAAGLTRRLADADVDEFARTLTATDPRVILALDIIGDAVTLEDPAD